MKPETVRNRMRSMARRLQQDQDALERMFPRYDWGGGEDAIEAIRNLATAIAWIKCVPAMSDDEIREATAETNITSESKSDSDG